MTNPTTIALPVHSDTVNSEAEWFGTNIGNEVRSSRANREECTDDEVPSCVDIAWDRWSALCTRYGWSGVDRDSAWPLVVDAYYDRATGAA